MKTILTILLTFFSITIRTNTQPSSGPYPVPSTSSGPSSLATNVVSGIGITNATIINAFITNSVFAGNGGNITNLNASNIMSGTLLLGQLPSAVVTNFSTTPTFIVATFIQTNTDHNYIMANEGKLFGTNINGTFSLGDGSLMVSQKVFATNGFNSLSSAPGFTGNGSGLNNVTASALSIYRAGTTNIANLTVGQTVQVLFNTPFPPNTTYALSTAITSPEATAASVNCTLLTTNGFLETVVGLSTGTFTNTYIGIPYQ